MLFRSSPDTAYRKYSMVSDTGYRKNPMAPDTVYVQTNRDSLAYKKERELIEDYDTLRIYKLHIIV